MRKGRSRGHGDKDDYSPAGRKQPAPPLRPGAGRAWPAYLLSGYAPGADWHSHPATPKQLAALERRGLEPPDGLTKGEAACALSRPSPKQKRLLEARGLAWPGMTFEEAKEQIDRLALREGWGR